jgi:hypothetical protein
MKIILSGILLLCICTTVMAQNVGINNTNPNRPLTITGTGNNHELISLRDTSNTTKWHVNLLDSGLNFAQTGVADARFFLHSRGHAGFGTTNPQYPVVITKTDLINTALNIHTKIGGDFGQLSLIRFTNTSFEDTSGYYSSFIGGGRSSGGSSYLVFGTSPDNLLPAERMRINKDGNVGIGTSTPAVKLDVFSSAPNSTVSNFSTPAGFAQIHVTNSVDTAEIGINSFGMFIGTVDDADVYIRTNGTARMSVKNGTGNVGIGQTFPLNKLDVEGAVAIGTSFSGNYTAPANGLVVEGKVGIGQPTPVNKLDVEGAVAIGAGFSGNITAPVNGLVVEGKVGIGHQSPLNKLDVEGAVAIGAGFSGNQTAPVNGLLVAGYVGIGTANPTASLVINGAQANTPADITINSVNQTINPGNRSYIRLINNTGIISTITLADGVADGQLLTILAISGGIALIQFVDNAANNTQLNSNFTMGTDDTLQLIWDTGRSTWIELHRSVN